MGRKSRFESEALQYAYNRYVGRDKKKAEAFDAELAMLRRIAAGLNKRVEIRFVPLKRATGTA